MNYYLTVLSTTINTNLDLDSLFGGIVDIIIKIAMYVGIAWLSAASSLWCWPTRTKMLKVSPEPSALSSSAVRSSACVSCSRPLDSQLISPVGTRVHRVPTTA